MGEARDIDYRGSLRLISWLKLRGSFISIDFEGSNAPKRDLSFVGVDFPQGELLESDLNLQQFAFGVEVDVLRSTDGYLAVVAEYSQLEARPTVTSPGRAQARGGPFRVQLPTFGLKARVHLTRALSVTAEATGMKREGDGVMTNLEGSIVYNLSRNLAFSVGYRNSYTKWKPDSADRATFRLKGNYFSVVVRI